MSVRKNIDELTSTEYNVMKEQGTEPPFQNEYWNHFEEGIYVDKISGKPLFTSKDKFHSSCGWPSFSKGASDDITEHFDDSFGMRRTEVRSSESDSHLGHLFDDGPEELGGLRYCINSAAVIFIPKNELEEKGYKEYVEYFND